MTGPIFEISRAGHAHADLLARIHAASFERGWTAEEFAALLAPPGTWVLLAARPDAATGHEPLGFIMMRTAGDETECLTLCTRPEARRTGVARGLLRAALADPACSAGRVFLEVAENNVAALSLYRTAGFAEVGRRKAYYATSDGRADALVLTRQVESVA